MATVKINVNIDAETKREAEKLLSEIGLTMTAAINIYLKRMLVEGRVPFEVGINVPNDITIAAIEEGERLLSDPSRKRYDDLDDFWAAMEQ